MRIMFPTILSRRFAPAASVQSSYLTLSGCFRGRTLPRRTLSGLSPSSSAASDKPPKMPLRHSNSLMAVGNCAAAADTVLKKVEKYKHVQHVQMTTRGVQLLGREG